MKKRIDYLSNKQNKYSIRRFTVGTTSVIVGATILFGIGNHQAQASEQSNDTTQSSKNNASADSEKNNMIETPQLNTTANDTSDISANTNSANVDSTAKPMSTQTSNTTTTEPASTNETPQPTAIKDQATAAKMQDQTVPQEANSQVDNKTTKDANSIATNSELKNPQTLDLPQSSPQTISNAQGTSKPSVRTRAVRSLTVAEPVVNAADAKGTNVNDKVTASNLQLQKTTFDPNQSGNTFMAANFTVTDKVKSGDYFTAKLPDSLTGNGDVDYSNSNNTMPIADIKSTNGDVVAKATYDILTKTYTFVFTDYVNDKENINGQFSLPLFTDRAKAPKSGTYDANINIADEMFDNKITYNYSSPIAGIDKPNGANISSQIIGVDTASGQNTYKQTVFVNPKQRVLGNTWVYIKGYQDKIEESSGKVSATDTKLRIFEVNDTSKLSDSYYADPNDSNLKEVTGKFNNRIFYEHPNVASINFGDINKTYVVLVEGHYDNTGKNLKTQVIQENIDPATGKDYSIFGWNNENVVRYGGGSADGDSAVNPVDPTPGPPVDPEPEPEPTPDPEPSPEPEPEPTPDPEPSPEPEPEPTPDPEPSPEPEPEPTPDPEPSPDPDPDSDSDSDS
ncbi:MSCRAMM family adhesin clumping factor ClfB, partial [Staphylococcus aureus]|uniref:MSCRAMM family adhesin clumping factor ClfB n=1 Tax=Staphylococcus aureus TaxID=1280 RepID=UPI00045386ED